MNNETETSQETSSSQTKTSSLKKFAKRTFFVTVKLPIGIALGATAFLGYDYIQKNIINREETVLKEKNILETTNTLSTILDSYQQYNLSEEQLYQLAISYTNFYKFFLEGKSLDNSYLSKDQRKSFLEDNSSLKSYLDNYFERRKLSDETLNTLSENTSSEVSFKVAKNVVENYFEESNILDQYQVFRNDFYQIDFCVQSGDFSQKECILDKLSDSYKMEVYGNNLENISWKFICTGNNISEGVFFCENTSSLKMIFHKNIKFHENSLWNFIEEKVSLIGK